MAGRFLLALAPFLHLLHVIPVLGELKCGERFTDFVSESSGLVGGREADPSDLSAPTQAFPWLVKVVVVSPRLELLCGGVIATPTVVLLPAHCITGIPTETIRVLVGQKRTDSDSIHDVAYHLENVILHPKYNSSTTSQVADLAVIKLEPRKDFGSIQWGNYSAPACLPNEGEQPSEGCQVMQCPIHSFFNSYLSHQNISPGGWMGSDHSGKRIIEISSARPQH